MELSTFSPRQNSSYLEWLRWIVFRGCKVHPHCICGACLKADYLYHFGGWPLVPSLSEFHCRGKLLILCTFSKATTSHDVMSLIT